MRYIGASILLYCVFCAACSSAHSYPQNSNRLPTGANSNNRLDSLVKPAEPRQLPKNDNPLKTLEPPENRVQLDKEDEATILFERPDGKSVTLKFTGDEFSGLKSLLATKNAEDLKKAVERVASTLKKAGEECCEERKKVSTCKWVCCDGTKASSCNKTMNVILTNLWGD